jgi:hypothetical protein
METKNRSIEELLIVLRGFIVRYEYFNGMCGAIRDMDIYFGYISLGERDNLITFITDKGPKKQNPLGYWFPIGEKQPRIDWINEQIKILQNGK